MSKTSSLMKSASTAAGKARGRLSRERIMRRERRQLSASPDGMEFLLVVTFGRTGSTVLQSALNACEGVCVRGENHQVVRHMYEAYRSVVRTAGEHGNASAVKLDDPWFGAHLIRAEEMLARFRETLVVDVLRPPVGTRVTGFKEIRHTCTHFASYEDLLDYLLFLDRMLPGVRMVINVRDPEETAKSGWWREDPQAVPVMTTTREWLRRASRDLEARLGAGRVWLLEYEEWDRNPPALIAMLSAFGLKFSRSTIERVVGTHLQHLESAPKS